MDKLTVSAVGDGNPLHHSMSDQQPTADEKALELLRGADQNRAAAADAQMSARMKLEQLDRSVDIKELDAYFMTLEEERRGLQELLEEQKQEHELDLKAIERERLQERLEWELMMQEREEALRSALMSVAITKHKMKKDLLARLVRQPLLQSLFFICFCPQVGTSTASAREPKTNALQEMAKMEERVRSTEMGKQEKALLKAEAAEKKRQQKALQQAQKEAAKAQREAAKVKKEEAAKAQKEAAKAEKEAAKAQKEATKAQKEEAAKAQKEAAKAQKEAAKAQKAAGKNRAKELEEKNDSSSSQPGCSTQSNVMPAEQDRKEKKTVGCFGFLFKRKKASKTNKAATEQ
ncbi:hypothetical protein ACEWY4_025985 [Coilia grayii]|uniref:Uncharacterized protein n=1 Tax=Coilia grayii TaxID=363190 RepID=A0ABD1IWB9_9TELE